MDEDRDKVDRSNDYPDYYIHAITIQLIGAAEAGDLEYVRDAIERGAPVNYEKIDENEVISRSLYANTAAGGIVSEKETHRITTQINNALVCAAANGHAEIVRYLLSIPGIDVNLVASERKLEIEIYGCRSVAIWHSKTALMAAVTGGHVEVVKLLLKVPNIEVNYRPGGNRNYRSGTVLYEVVRRNEERMVELLLAIPGIDLETGFEESVMSWYTGKTRVEKTTPLMAAEGNPKIKKMLERALTERKKIEEHCKKVLSDPDSKYQKLKSEIESLTHEIQKAEATHDELAKKANERGEMAVIIDRDWVNITKVGELKKELEAEFRLAVQEEERKRMKVKDGEFQTSTKFEKRPVPKATQGHGKTPKKLKHG